MDHSFGSAEEVDHVMILQSCNGLLLCSRSAWTVFYYVYNPSTNLFKRLSQPNYYLRDDSCFFSSSVFRLAYDPRKSSHYKVVQAGGEAGETWIQIYSSETGNWSFYIDRGMNFLESLGGPINDLILLLMELPHMLYLEWKFFESYRCLLLVCRDDIGSTEFTIYEMMKGSSMWSVRKVVKNNLISNTNTEIFDIGSNQMDDDDDDDADDDNDDAVRFFHLLKLILTFTSSFRHLQMCNYRSL
uniref:F-box associated beta-propeller type 1 domain-containing protein n=1 Tax=Tanacetum cinerariifolium TaxID=118510 RepID=A0A699L528_TANCI|nr:hypothetical protein [Tanacetum cinerariifolium]